MIYQVVVCMRRYREALLLSRRVDHGGRYGQHATKISNDKNKKWA